MVIERRSGSDSPTDALDCVLHGGIVIDPSLRVSLIGLVAMDARLAVASIETYLEYADATGTFSTGITPAVEGSALEPPSAEAAPIIRLVFDAWNAHDVERYAALLDEVYVEETHGQPAPLRGRDSACAAMQAQLVAIPDLHFAIEGIVATRNAWAVSWLATGTRRDASGHPWRRGRRMEVGGCTVSELKNGKLAYGWHYWGAGGPDPLRRAGQDIEDDPHGLHRVAPAS